METNELLLQIISEIKEFKQDTRERFDRIEKKLDITVTQTAELTEFRTKANANFDKLLDYMDYLKIHSVEVDAELLKLKRKIS